MANRPVISKLDHYAIEVRDLELTHHFYHQILGFDVVLRPDFDFPGAWYQLGNVSIHVILNTSRDSVQSNSRSLHFAFATPDLVEMKTYLIASGIEIAKDIKPRPDGVLQMFVRDPDGYFIEFTNVDRLELVLINLAK